MPDTSRAAMFFDRSAPWEQRLAFVVETMREMSMEMMDGTARRGITLLTGS